MVFVLTITSSSFVSQIRGPIVHVKGDILKAHSARNIPEREKPTLAMRLAQKTNIKKAQKSAKEKVIWKILNLQIF